MSNVQGLAIFLVGVFFALALIVLVPSTEAQSASGYRRAAPQGQYTLARWRRHHRRHYRRLGAMEKSLNPVVIVAA